MTTKVSNNLVAMFLAIHEKNKSKVTTTNKLASWFISPKDLQYKPIQEGFCSYNHQQQLQVERASIIWS